MPQKPSFNASDIVTTMSHLFDYSMRRVIYKAILKYGRKARVTARDERGVYRIEIYDEERVWWFFKRQHARTVVFLYPTGECTAFDIVRGTKRILA